MQAETIEEVIIQLEAIIDECIKTKNRAGYFAALYHKVTCAVLEGIRKNEFEDRERMARLDVLFANRYIAAWHASKKKSSMSKSWRAAFEQTKKRSTLVLQHLLLGINAHINLDLGIAAVETMNGEEISVLRRDFVRINTLLSSLLLDVLKDIQRVSPLSSILGLHARNGKSMLINFTIESARDGAWCFAEELSVLVPGGADFVNKRDGEIAKLGLNLSTSKGLLKITTLVIRLFEWNNPAKVIAVLRASHKTKFNEAVKEEAGKPIAEIEQPH